MRRLFFALVAGLMVTVFAGQANAAPPNHNQWHHSAYSPSYANYRGNDSWHSAPRYVPNCAPVHHHHVNYGHSNYGHSNHGHSNHGHYGNNNSAFGYSGNRVSFWFGF